MSKNYDDIVNMSRPESKHPKMSLHDRAAQFSPFAALTGYEDAIKEKQRLTQRKKELTNEEKEEISNKIGYILENKVNEPIKICYFVPDPIKDGGKYIELEQSIKKIDKYNREIILDSKLHISFDNIISIDF